jgi:hypothetical protein
MPPTPDRSTVQSAIDALVSRLGDNLVANPPAPDRPFRCVEVSDATSDEFPRPFLTLRLTRTRLVSTFDNDMLVEVVAAMRVVTDVSASNPHAALLDQVGAVDDELDGIVDAGLIEGAQGFDDRGWSFEYPRGAAGSRVACATATLVFVVKIEREHNRAAAG